MLTIPGVPLVHGVEEWVEPCFPMTGPLQWAQDIYQPVAHYSAALDLPDGDIGEFDYQIIPFLRAAQRDYWLNRDNGTSSLTICGRTLEGYALGYLFAVDWLGGAWELRGFRFRSAANNGHNTYTAPLLLLTDRYDPPSELMMATCRAIWREFRARSGRADFRNRPLGHGELKTYGVPPNVPPGIGTATSCPGGPVLDAIHNGWLDLDIDDDGGNNVSDRIPWKTSVRAYDSRPSEQGAVDANLRQANADIGTPLEPLAPFASRRILVGLASAASVVVHAIGHGQAGFISVTGEPQMPPTSLVNFNGAAPVRDVSVSLGLTEGSIWVHGGPTPCDFIVEVTDRW